MVYSKPIEFLITKIGAYKEIGDKKIAKRGKKDHR